MLEDTNSLDAPQLHQVNQMKETAAVKCSVLNSFSTFTVTIEPRHEKTYLQEFPTRPDTNRPAQPQNLARVLEFRL